MTWKMRLVELRNMLAHLISIKGKSLMVPKVKSLTNNVENNICDEVNFFFVVLIRPRINNKLPPIINGIKLTYTAVNKILIFASFV